ncbi:MAG: protein kinase [Deltaproteobacteria bacterium]|nr:protein kinase [Deltaproteobacteria bacterium]MBP7291054.1 protein kinase [Nannocystaceae bacterium]
MSQPSPHTPAETTPGLAPALEAPTPGRSAPAFLLRGDIVGRYVVLDKIGTGGMGIVYAAYDPELDRKIALKLLRPGARGRAEIARARLLREAQALARLNHPSVIAVHDVGTFEDQVFVAMEFVDGIDAAKWLQSERRTWREVLPVWRQAAEGLAAAHAAGVVHRDFKPENMLVGNDARVRVLDFGLARTAGTDPTVERNVDEVPAERLTQSSASVQLTQAGAVMGTPAYMAPEQHTGAPLDARTDQFSFCVSLYEALYGERPFAGERVPEIAFNVVRGRVREPSREGPTVPAWLRKVVLRGLATDPDQRWPDMRALLAALAADPAARQRRFALIAVAGGVLGAGALMLSSLRPDEAVCRGAERKLEGIWDPTVRAALEQGFAGSTLPFATDALASTTALLDEHAARFVALHTDACEATAIRKEQSQDMLDRQVACLERRLKDVRALTRLLAHADDDAVAQAVTATSSLPSFEPCADRQALLSREPVPSGEQAAALAEVDDQLAAGLQQLRLAHYREALQTAEAAVTAARSTADPGTIAQALVLLGRTQLALDDGEAAERSLREAAWTADEGGADLVRAEADKDLVWVVSAMPGRAREAEDLAASTTHTLKRIGGDALVEADLHENLGVAARRRGAIEQAVAEHERALALRREHLPTGDPRIADSLLNLGTALTDAGTYDAADAALGEAEQIVRARYGGRHPRVANALHSRGIVLLRRGDPAGAAALLRQATEIREAALPQGHAVIAGSHHDLGEVFAVAKDWAQARTQFDLAVRLREAGKATHPAHLANSLRGRGLAELELGQIEPARATLERAWLLLEHSQDAAARAEIDFAYARALVASDARTAIALARTARGAYLAIDAQRPGAVGRAAAVQEIEAWLRQHDPDRAPRP